MSAADLFRDGKLDEALAACVDEVKKNPTDIGRRALFCELLCFSGNLERADTQLDTIMKQQPEAILLMQFRHLLRAEMARREFYSSGRLPEFLTEPPEYLRKHLQASICLREGKPAEALELLSQAESERPKVSGTVDGTPFSEMRDLDDMTAPFLEVLTANGKYYWVPFDAVTEIEFRPPERPKDLLWRSVHLGVANGPEGEVFIPVLYPGTESSVDSQLKLGRSTDWVAEDGSPVKGVGQRMMLFDETDKTLMELESITINAS